MMLALVLCGCADGGVAGVDGVVGAGYVDGDCGGGIYGDVGVCVDSGGVVSLVMLLSMVSVVLLVFVLVMVVVFGTGGGGCGVGIVVVGVRNYDGGVRVVDIGAFGCDECVCVDSW